MSLNPNTYLNPSVYGEYRTNSFVDIYPNAESFSTDYAAVGIPQKLSKPTSISTIYYLLYARYGNSHIASSDQNQFKYKLFSIIFMYGPTWEKRLDIQDKLRAIPEADLLVASKIIYNHAYNPGTEPTTSTLEELEAINEQNTTNYKRSKLDAYGTLIDLLETDVTSAFLDKFKRLFITVVEPQKSLYYENDPDNVEIYL